MIYIGSDHRGYKLKEKIKDFLELNSYDFSDVGTFYENDTIDYPNIAHKLCKILIYNNNINDIGILICFTANGMAMTANKYPEIRAAICWNKEISKLSREHNDANILCLPSNFLEDDHLDILKNFLFSKFEGGRHQKRIKQINKINITY
jgi:ribose 5-phosphate isomerase B